MITDYDLASALLAVNSLDLVAGPVTSASLALFVESSANFDTDLFIGLLHQLVCDN